MDPPPLHPLHLGPEVGAPEVPEGLEEGLAERLGVDEPPGEAPRPQAPPDRVREGVLGLPSFLFPKA